MTRNNKKRRTAVLRKISLSAGCVCLLAGLSSQAWAFDPVITPEIDPGAMTAP